jgi:hypothetical protein
MPFQPSPHRDDGYDTQDYYGVDARKGTLRDFIELIQRARARGIRVIIGLVINHTSDQHPWFQEARCHPTSKYYDYYCYWSKKKPTGAHQGSVNYFDPKGDPMHMILNFQVNQQLFYGFASGDCRPLAKALLATRQHPEIGQLDILLRTHAELDLGQLSDEARQRVFETLAPDKDMPLYERRIWRCLATMLGGD